MYYYYSCRLPASFFSDNQALLFFLNFLPQAFRIKIYRCQESGIRVLDFHSIRATSVVEIRRLSYGRVRNAYLAIAVREPQRVVVVDARGSPDETHRAHNIGE
jgi:hypothetical protein